MSEMPEKIWVLFSESDGEYVYLSEQEAKKTKKRWKKEDKEWNVACDLQGPFQYVLKK